MRLRVTGHDDALIAISDYSLIQPFFDYCNNIMVWVNYLSKVSATSLQKLQSRVGKVILRAAYKCKLKGCRRGT